MTPKRFAPFVWLATTALVQAHPGHDLLDHGVTHFASSSFHLLTLIAIGFISALAARFVQSFAVRRFLHAFATLCIVAAAATVICR